jgi:hypothetical protein
VRFSTNIPTFVATVGALLLSLNPCKAQGAFHWTVTFDGPPSIPTSSSISILSYYEQGMRFAGIGANGRFGRSGGFEELEGFPRNGGAYIYAMFQEAIAVDSLYGDRFGVVSVDLSEFSTLYAIPLTVPFIGYRADGSTVTTEFVTDGVIDGAGPLNDFETFYFDSRFADLIRLEMPSYSWSMDNMVFSDAVPEPSTFALTIFGAALIGVRFFKRAEINRN